MQAGRTTRLLVLLTASTGCAMTVLDTNIVAIILPAVARAFATNFTEVEWVVSSYVLCFAALLLPAGAVADRYGRRRVFLVGILLFALASLACALSGSVAMLNVARASQGVGAAFLLAPALAIIGHAFHDESERNRAWSIWGSMMGLTMVLAPIIGGVIAHLAGWRWAFGINLPICTLLAVAVLAWVEDSRDRDARRIDPAGIVLFAVAMFGITSALIGGGNIGWIVGGLGLIAFILAEALQTRPMLDLTLFQSSRFVGAVLAMFAYAATAQVMASLLPQFLQNGLGRNAFQTGFAMLPFALTMLILPHVGRRLANHLSSRGILTLGLLTVAAGNGLAGWGASSSSWFLVALGMAVLGSGGGLLNGETQKAIMSTVPRERAGMASGISTTARFSGILLGFAALSGVLAAATRTWLLAQRCDSDEACAALIHLADAVVAGTADGAAYLSGMPPELAHHAYAHGFSVLLWVAAVVACVAAATVCRLMWRS